jgi:hypothetical protein
MTMLTRIWLAMTAGLVAMLTTTTPVAADDLIPLDIKGGAGVATFRLDLDEDDDDIELIRHRGGYRGGYHGGYRGGYGGYRGGYYGGYRGAYYGGYRGGVSFSYGRGYYGGYHRPYYSSYYYGGYGSSYPRHYGSRVYISAGYYQPYSSYYSPYYNYYPSNGYYCPLNGASVMPYATTLDSSPYAPVQNLQPGVTNAPAPQGPGTFRYDGGPSTPVPLPGQVQPAPTSKPAPPPPPAANTRLVSIPSQPATGFAYPAYGQPARPTSFATDERR